MEEAKTIRVEIEKEMKESYLDYAMSVVVSRALPDVRDGLKPVHRRILYAMHELGLYHNKPYKKSARIVGEVLGKYHPHGDTAVYDSLVRMVQDFSLRYPLVDGQGNFGSVDGDNAAAMRYTEARLAKISDEMLRDIEKETVDFASNFDATLNEPTVLPAYIPNILINGSSGIAVGMTTNIPPHNLAEVIDAAILLIDNPGATVEDLMRHIKGPDFPTAGYISGRGGVVQAYKTGRGHITLKAKTEIEEHKGKQRIIVKEIPYQVNKAMLVESIADLAKDGVITGISDIRDESDRTGMRVVIEIKSNASTDLVLNQLFKHTQLQTTFGIINTALVNNRPETLTLRQILQKFVEHRLDVLLRRSKFDLKKAEERAHILEGLRKALEDIDLVVKLVKGSKTPTEAKESLMHRLKLTEAQSLAILDMKIQRLTALERGKIEEELEALRKEIAHLKSVLADQKKQFGVIKDELLRIKKEYGDARKTEILDAEEQGIETEDLIEEQKVLVTITNAGYVKRTPVELYRQQRRGGKGVISMETKEEDIVRDIYIASTHDYMLFFTDKGRVFWLKVYQIPEAGRYSKGKAIVNLLELKDEKVVTAIKIDKFDERSLIAVTKKGLVKKTQLVEYSRPRRTGIAAAGLREGDELVKVLLVDESQTILIASKKGKAVHFKSSVLRPMGRMATGVRGIRLVGSDEVVAAAVPRDQILTITENGYGKRTEVEKYPVKGRGGQGVIDIKTEERNGHVVDILTVTESDDVMVITTNGVAIRMQVKDVALVGRNTKGVRIIKLENDKVAAIAKIPAEDKDNGANGEDKQPPKKGPHANGDKTERPLESEEEIDGREAEGSSAENGSNEDVEEEEDEANEEEQNEEESLAETLESEEPADLVALLRNH